MNQPNLPVIAPRAAVSMEPADMLVSLRRYAWLLISGTILGTAAGAGLYFYIYKNEPRYTASIPFQVLPPPAPIGIEQQYTPQFNPDDISQLIHRQEFLFQQEPFLDEVMKNADFHTNPANPATAGSDESGWLHDNKRNLMKAIKRDLQVVPRINAAAFEITMRAKDPYEAYVLVTAAADVYLKHIEADNSALKQHRLQSLRDEVQKRAGDVQTATDTLAAWAKAHEVDVQRSRFEIEKQNLQDLNEEYIRANALAVTADAQARLIDRLLAPVRDDAGKIDLDKLKQNGILLTPDMEQTIENDPTIRSLDGQRLSWLQEDAVEKAKPAPSPPRLIDIRNRILIIDQQKKDETNRLRGEAAGRMADLAKNDAESKQALTNNVDNSRKEKEKIVRTIGQDLMEYQQKVDALKEKQDLMYKVNNQFNLADANKGTDDVRVQKLTDANRPSEISEPRWLFYIPVGSVLGLGLSALMAYLLLLTDTRVRTPRDISRSLQLSLLGFVPDENDDRTLTGDVETAILSSPASMMAESFRQIRSHAMAQTAHNPANTMLVASIAPGGGATTVASNLAAAMALNDIRVLLVDANFYRPGLNRIYSNIPAKGLADALVDPESLESSIVPHPSLPKLHLLGAGSELSGASSELFEGRAFRDLIEKLKSRYDMIIFDGAPLNLVSDSLALAARVDGVVSVVRAGEVSRGTVTRVRDQLRNVHANLLGFVLNAVQTNNSGYFKENYRTFYRYAGQPRRSSTPK